MADANTVEGMCMVCGDKSAGRHYGVMACYGCKVKIWKVCNMTNQRNACRFCRFQRCLQVGMEPDAIRPDRDVIGKQKNPRKRKLVTAASNISTFGNINGFVLKQEESSLPSPSAESNSSQHSEDHLLGALMNVEMRYGSNKSVASGRGGVTSFANSFGPETSVASASLEIPIGIAPPHHHQIFRRSIKIDSDVQLMTLIQNRALLEELRCAATASSSCMSINTDRYGFGHADGTQQPHSSQLFDDGENSGDAIFKCCDTASSRHYIPSTHALSSKSASLEQISEAMRLYVLSCIGWINAMFRLARLETDIGVASLGTTAATLLNDKMIILKNTFAAFCTFEQATHTARAETIAFASSSSSSMATIPTAFDGNSSLCLCNGRWIARNVDRQYLDTNLLANNIVGRILDELVFPLRRLSITDQERVTLIALIILEGDCRRVDARTSAALYTLKERVQNALFQHIRERDIGDASLSRASTRFANVLLLLPSVAKVSAIYYENAQLAKMFGRDSLDPLLAEIFLDTSSLPSTTMTASGDGCETFHQHTNSTTSFPHSGQTISSVLYDDSLSKSLTVADTSIDSRILSSDNNSCSSIMTTLKTPGCLMSRFGREPFNSNSGRGFSPPNVLPPCKTATTIAGSCEDLTVNCYESATTLGEGKTLHEKINENAPSPSDCIVKSVLPKLTSSTSMTSTIFDSSYGGEVRSADDEDQMSSIVAMGLELADEQQRQQQLLLVRQEDPQTLTTLRHSSSNEDVAAVTSTPDQVEASFLMQHLFSEKSVLNESSAGSAAHTTRHCSGNSACSGDHLSSRYENSSTIDAAPTNRGSIDPVANKMDSPNLEPISPPHSAFNAPEVFSHNNLSNASVVAATVPLSSTSSVVIASPAVASFAVTSTMALQELYGSTPFYSEGKSDGASAFREPPPLQFNVHHRPIASSSSADLFMECNVNASQIAAHQQQYHNTQQQHHEQQQQEYFLNELQHHHQQLLLHHHHQQQQQHVLQQQLLSRSQHQITNVDSSSSYSSTAVVDGGGGSISGCISNFEAFSS